MPLNDQDSKYVSRKLGLSQKLVGTLTEDEKDTNLLLSHVAVKDIKKSDINKITFLTYIKLLVFRYSHDTGFDINEKDYVSKCVYFLYLQIRKGLDYKLITDKTGPSEKKSQYYLVLSGLFHKEIPSVFFPSGYQNFIEEGWRKTRYELSKHVTVWIDVLREIDKKRWLEASIKNIKKEDKKEPLLLTN